MKPKTKVKVKYKVRPYPDTSDVGLVKSNAGLLEEALMKLRKDGRIELKINQAIHDDYGKVAYLVSDRYVLVAKKSPYGRIVSIAGDLMQYAIGLNRVFLMYLSGRFYVIQPWLVSRELKFRNHRGDVEMWNFDIGLCIPLDKYLNSVVEIKPNVQMALF